MPAFRPALRGLLLRVLVTLAVALVALVTTSRASAQAITIINEATLPRLKADSTTKDKRSQQQKPEAVSFQDCVEDQKIRFPVTLSGAEGNAEFRVFASVDNDCKEQQARSTGVASCWPLGGNYPIINAPQNIDIPVRQIMSGRLKPQQPDSSAAICGQVDLSTIQVNFLYFAPGTAGGTATTVKTVKIEIDTVGPDPPTGLAVLPGNTRLEVNWKNISGGDPDASTGIGGTSGSGVVVLTGVKVYCDPQSATGGGSVTEDASCEDVPIDGGVNEAGVAIDAGVSTVCTPGRTTTLPAAACASPNFVNADGSPKLPDNDFNTKYECGSLTGNTGTSITATQVGRNPLVNGTRYAVAVASTDAYGNVGKLSAVICETPELTTDFWEQYRQQGGGAGGCAVGADAPLGSMAMALTVFAVLVTSLRKRSRRKIKR